MKRLWCYVSLVVLRRERWRSLRSLCSLAHLVKVDKMKVYLIQLRITKKFSCGVGICLGYVLCEGIKVKRCGLRMYSCIKDNKCLPNEIGRIRVEVTDCNWNNVYCLQFVSGKSNNSINM